MAIIIIAVAGVVVVFIDVAGLTASNSNEKIRIKTRASQSQNFDSVADSLVCTNFSKFSIFNFLGSVRFVVGVC